MVRVLTPPDDPGRDSPADAPASDAPTCPMPARLGRGDVAALLAATVMVLALCIGLVVHDWTRAPLARPPAPAGGAAFQLDVNTAGWAQLSLVPGLGPALSRAVVAYREEHGRIASLDELVSVRGIGEKRLEQLRPWLTVGDGEPGDSAR